MHRRLPPLNALKAFEAAARHLSFTKAADELFVTQAAVSHQIKALEEFLSMKLFIRRNRTLLLTEEGQAYFLELKDIFKKDIRSDEDLNFTLELIKKYNIIKECYKKAEHFINLASNSLTVFEDSGEKKILENLTSFSLERSF